MSEYKRPWIKVCGLASDADVLACHAIGIDAVGFLVVPSTQAHRNKDQLLLQEASHLTRDKQPGMDYVILTHSRSIKDLLEIAVVAKPNIIQLQSDVENLNSAIPLLSAMGIKLFKKIPVSAGTSASEVLSLIDSYGREESFGAFVLDTAKGSGGRGGTGKIHDWRISAQVIQTQHSKRFILAGGLSPANVREALTQVKPWGIDVMTGVSIERGVKDLKAVKFLADEVAEFFFPI